MELKLLISDLAVVSHISSHRLLPLMVCFRLLINEGQGLSGSSLVCSLWLSPVSLLDVSPTWLLEAVYVRPRWLSSWAFKHLDALFKGLQTLGVVILGLNQVCDNLSINFVTHIAWRHIDQWAIRCFTLCRLRRIE